MSIAILVFLCSTAFALSFPDLTGRVVDDAHILSPAAAGQLEQTLAAFEQESGGDQVVVATVPSLQGTSIEDYGYQLGRKWGIGQKGKDNGVILLVAPKERKVRIEVGYGLEPVLTDALSSAIIQTIILPEFRQGNMENGVVQGTYAIVTALGGKTSLGAHPPVVPAHNGNDSLWPFVIFVIVILLRVFILPWWFPVFFPFNSRGSYGGGFGGGFSGGGGSFGGGGASGGW